MNKKELIKQIVEQLFASIELYSKAAQSSRAEATHEQNKAESKYDTRGLEASYLARGQSRQLAEIEQAIAQFQSLPLLEFGSHPPIQLSALVALRLKREKLFYFIGPRAGGMEIEFEGKEISVITPQSPLGQLLMGKKQGDRIQLRLGATQNEYTIVSVE